MGSVMVVPAGTEWIPAPKGLRFDRLNPVQAAFLPYAGKDLNVVVAAATSAGKTLIAELAIAPVLAGMQKAIYLAPLKALAQEKLEDWSLPDHPTLGGYKVVLATGDTMFGRKRDQVLASCKEADILCLTSEMLDSLTRRFASEKNNWLADVGCIVVDEAHLLAMEERGDKLESALMRFTAQNQGARLVLLSATMPNVRQIGDWATRLNGKDTVVIESQWRPVPLTVSYPVYSEFEGRGSYRINKDRQIAKLIEVVQESRANKHRVLIFVHSKNDGHAIQKELEILGERVEFHNADLERLDRGRIERAFRDKESDLGCIVATSTLAYGLNLPARVVVICGSHRGLDLVHPYDIRQEIGRAGRYGLDERGDVFIVLGDKEVQRERVRLESLPPISSQMELPDVLLFHMVAEVAEGYHSTGPDLWRWYQRSLAASRNSSVEPHEFARQVDILTVNGVLNVREGRLEATGVGRVSSWFYYHPLDVADWARNLRRVRNWSDLAVAWALCHVHTSIRIPFIPKILQPAADEFKAACWKEGGFPCGNESVLGYAYWMALTKTDKQLPLGWMMEVRSIRRDSERVAQAIGQLDSLYLHLGMGEFWKEIGMRMQHGVGADLIELVSNLEGIGPERARMLHSAGYSGLQDVAKAGPVPLSKVIGKRLGVSIWAQAKKILNERRVRHDAIGG